MRSVAPRGGARARRGLTLLEVLIGLAIMLAGILAIAAVFPYALGAQRDTELLTVAAALAQQKAEEIRRDDSVDGDLVREIRSLGSPTAAAAFETEPRLQYQFSGATVLYASLPTSDPRATPGVARVIVSYAPGYKASQDVVYELRFN